MSIFVEMKSAIGNTVFEAHEGDLVEFPDSSADECQRMEERGIAEIVTQIHAKLRADMQMKRIKKYIAARPEPTPTRPKK